METAIKKLLQQTLESLVTKGPAAIAPDGKDEIGLPIEDRRYVKHNCNVCLGRGKVTRLDLTDEPQAEVQEDNDTGLSPRATQRRALRAIARMAKVLPRHDRRTEESCHCMANGYSRTRREIERRALSDLKLMGASNYSEDRQATLLQDSIKKHRQEMGF